MKIAINKKIVPFLIVSLLSFMVIVVYGIVRFQEEHKHHLSLVDKQLILAATATDNYLGSSFHNQKDSQSISPEKELAITRVITDIAAKGGVVYVYSLVKVGNVWRFITSSAVEGELESGNYEYVYWTEYKGADPGLDKALRMKSLQYAEYKDRWGEFRSVFIPYVSADGTQYIVGADISLSELAIVMNKVLREIVVSVATLILLLCIWAFTLLHEAKKRRKIEQRFEMAVSAVDVGVWEWDIPTGKSFFSNRFFLSLGYSDDEVPKTHRQFLDEFIFSDDRDRYEKSVLRSLSGNTPHSEILEIKFRLLNRQGEPKWIRSLGQSAEYDASGLPLKRTGTLTNIDEQQQAIEALARFKQFAENSGQGFGMAELDLSMIYMNPALRSLVGENNDTGVYSDKLSKYYPNETHEKLETCIIPQVMKAGSWSGEIDILGADGTLLPTKETFFLVYDETGAPKYIGDVITDITELKENQTKIENKEAQFRTLVNNIQAAAYRVSLGERSKILFVSNQIEALTGYPSTRFIGDSADKSLRDLIHPDDVDEVISASLDAISNHKAYVNQFRVVNSKGDILFYRDHGQGVYDKNGQPIYVDGVLFDITDKIKIEQDLAKAKSLAEEANRAKSIFLSNMSHEIRTPLNAVIGYAQLLERQENIPEDVLVRCKKIHQASRRLLNIINGILDLAKIESGRMHVDLLVFDIESELASLAQIFRDQAQQKNLLFQEDIDIPVGTKIQADKQKIIQVITNLLGNAIKFTERGFVGVRAHIANDRIHLSISDSGVGMSQDEQVKLFTPFDQGSAGMQAGGTGLGLTISKQMTEIMDGSIRIDSEQGQGTQVLVSVPIKLLDRDNTASETLVARDNLRLAKDQQLKVLAVDDDENARDIMANFLRYMNAEVVVACDGREALDIVDESIDLVITDIRMPNVDGEELLAILAQRPDSRKIPVIASTASSLTHEKDRFLKAGFVGYLSKPYEYADLCDQIAKATKVVMVEAVAEKINVSPRAQTLSEEELLSTLRELHEACHHGDITKVKKLFAKVSGKTQEIDQFQQLSAAIRSLNFAKSEDIIVQILAH